MRRSNYSIFYRPREDFDAGHSVTIEVSEEFIGFAKKQEINKESYERLTLDSIKNTGWSHYDEGMVSRGPHGGGSCIWWKEEGKETGLLEYLNIPGKAAGMGLEELSHGWQYSPFNMDSASQASVVLAVMTHYLRDIELRIPRA